MKKYKIQTQIGTEIKMFECIDYDDRMYLKCIVNHQIIAIYAPNFWLSIEEMSED
jgi:hypothetical protein